MTFRFRQFASGLTILAAFIGSASAATISVKVADAAGNPIQDAAVYAEPVTPPSGGRPKTAEIEQKSRKFMPLMTVVQTGTEISFPNNDTVRHHVYSFSPAKPFELKLYSGTPGTPILFDKPGTVVIGCNIHDQMVAYIQVVGTPHFGKTDQTGKVSIADLGPGKYRLKAWHYQLPSPAAPVETDLSVAKNDMTANLVLNIKAAGGSH
ncbi:methylamine utilization protein [Noviherbaspirillum suwonense]|nr:methylamine utilization protein [Noviherbaspirillum suwonense]